jgi:hypothetical protein
MNSPTDSTIPSTCGQDPKTRDYGNALAAFTFLFLAASDVAAQDWLDAATWFCFAAACAIMMSSGSIAGENWKKPRSLAAITLLVFGAGLFFGAPTHHSASTKRSEAPTANQGTPATTGGN